MVDDIKKCTSIIKYNKKEPIHCDTELQELHFIDDKNEIAYICPECDATELLPTSAKTRITGQV